MTRSDRPAISVHVRMKPYQRDLIDFRARTAGMSRSEFIVQTAAYGKADFRIDLDGMSDGQKKLYRVYRDGGLASGHVPQPDGAKPRKAGDGLVRSDAVSMRVSPYEKAALKKLSDEARMSVTDYMLLCTVYSPPPESNALNRDELRRLFIELRAQGRNLNQLTAAANRIASVAWRDDVDGSLIDQLCRELADDNERSRAGVNDAISAVVRVIEESDFRDAKRSGTADGAGDDAGRAREARGRKLVEG